jgi:hypothetical protein
MTSFDAAKCAAVTLAICLFVIFVALAVQASRGGVANIDMRVQQAIRQWHGPAIDPAMRARTEPRVS